MFEKKMDKSKYAKSNKNATMRLHDLQQNIPLLWQLNYHKYIDSFPELPVCHTIIEMTQLNAHTIFQTMKKVSYFIG